MVKRNSKYVPSIGDIVVINFDPQSGHEQKGRRPAVVISNYDFNKYTKMALVCPITNNTKMHPFHISLDQKQKTTGVIMCEQLKVIDYITRNHQYVETLFNETMTEVLDVIHCIIE